MYLKNTIIFHLLRTERIYKYIKPLIFFAYIRCLSTVYFYNLSLLFPLNKGFIAFKLDWKPDIVCNTYIYTFHETEHPLFHDNLTAISIQYISSLGLPKHSHQMCIFETSCLSILPFGLAELSTSHTKSLRLYDLCY